MIRMISQSNASKGKLFENLIAEILQKLGFTSIKLRCRQIGAEYDLEAVNSVTHEDVIGECKAWDIPISSEHLQKWLGKYVLVLSDKPNCIALFFSLSALGSEARSLYRKINKKYPKFVVHEPNDIINLLEKYNIVISSSVVKFEIKQKLPSEQLGKRFLIYSDKGFFWAQLFLKNGVPVAMTLLDSRGHAVSRSYALNVLRPDIGMTSLTYVDLPKQTTRISVDEETRSKIVGPPRGKGWFDYYYPADPAHFIGRSGKIGTFTKTLKLIRDGRSSHRGITIHGPSGIGKSSLVLKLQALIKKKGYLALAVDCRGCAGIDFFPLVLRNLMNILSESQQAKTTVAETQIDVFESIDKIDLMLRETKSAAVVFLDQFEYLIRNPEVIRQAKDLLLHLTATSARIVFVFTTKSDLTIQFADFPFGAWNVIKEQTFVVKLEEFPPKDVSEFIRILKKSIGSKLSSALIREVELLSKGRPWLLKRICSYISKAYEDSKLDVILKEGLKLDKLFKEDLERLNEDELVIIKAIARGSRTTTISNLQSPFDSAYTQELINNLVAKRLVLRIGDRYDLYHERFERYITEQLLAREEQLQIQIDLYIKLLPILSREQNREAIETTYRTLYKFYTVEKITYRIQDVVELLSKIGWEGGYKLHELRAKAFATMELRKESQAEYKRAIGLLLKGKRIWRGPTYQEVIYPLSINETISEVSRMKTDLGKTNVAITIRKIGQILKSGNEVEKLWKLSELAPSARDSSVCRILKRVYASLDRVVGGVRLNDIVTTVRRSDPEEIATTLLKTEFSWAEMVDFLKRSLDKPVYEELVRHFEEFSHDHSQSYGVRVCAADWLEIMTGEQVSDILTGDDVMPLIVRRLRGRKKLSKRSSKLIVDMFLKQPLQHVNVDEQARILFDLYFVWEKVILLISQPVLRRVFRHVEFLARNQFSEIRWFATLWLESLVDFREDISPARTSNLLLEFATDNAASIRRKSAEIMGSKPFISLISKSIPELQEKVMQKLKVLTVDEDLLVRDAAFKSNRVFASIR